MKGDVENLSNMVPRRSIDYVIDVESFFYYPDKQRFLSEVHSVMKEDGIFYLAFFIQRTRVEQIH